MSVKKWTKIGALKRKDESKPSYIVLDKNVEILVDGVKVDISKYRTVKLIDPSTRLEKMLESGAIDQATFDQRAKQLEDYGILYELTIPPVE